jgi:hypothetical protein
MKKSELRQLIKEEISNILKEEKQEKMQILADEMGRRIKQFGNLLRKEGYNV